MEEEEDWEEEEDIRSEEEGGEYWGIEDRTEEERDERV